MNDERKPLAPYKTSRDYAALWDLCQRYEVACFVDYDMFRDGQPLRDVCSTSAYAEPGEPMQIGARGVCYVYARNREEFVKRCLSVNLEWVVPDGGVQ